MDNKDIKSKQISAGADGGPRSRVCARLTLRSAPHRHQQKAGSSAEGTHSQLDFQENPPCRSLRKFTSQQNWVNTNHVFKY